MDWREVLFRQILKHPAVHFFSHTHILPTALFRKGEKNKVYKPKPTINDLKNNIMWRSKKKKWTKRFLDSDVGENDILSQYAITAQRNVKKK